MNFLSPLGLIADALNTWYTSVLGQIVGFLFQVTVPTVDALRSRFFLTGLGGTFGAASKIFGLVAVILCVAVVLRPNRRHGATLARFATTVLTVAAFGYLFFPLYSLLYSLSQGLTKGVINIAASSPEGTAAQLSRLINSVGNPDVISRIFTLLAAGTFTWIAFVEALILRVSLFAVLLFYPIILALRPLGKIPNTLFHISNSAIGVVVASPPLMGLMFVLPTIVVKLLPGAASIPLVTAALTTTGGILAAATPLFLAYFTFNASSEVFGRVESSVSGAIDSTVNGRVTVDEANRDVREIRASPLRTVASDVVGDEIVQGRLFSDMKIVVANTAGSAAAAAGHPEVGLAIKSAPAAVDAVKERVAKKKGDAA